MEVLIQCKTREAFTGITSQQDFDKNGYHNLVFHLTPKYIGVTINGFSSNYVYTFIPKTTAQKRANSYFINRYINVNDNVNSIKSKLGIN